MEKREYNLKKWESKDNSEILKTKREKKIIDMRETNIEEELINKHEKIYSNKKDLSNQRMASRDLIIQGLINPYLFENNYLDDINNQDRFLRPKDSNQKEKIQ
jgi:hypothetical protein